ncbi:hypothetical protein AVEN_64124-1 [Araneus ventricosus]|uniref:Endonuclease/exonuclease/phosphatase domain-containing protein n=1 Tax=Araneus ventricosus TaxID=182803 RepID=A0A4Y2C4P5_ARAVE|nr:hypothetical protein AVEN_64124-1 [Araneus ventricosus]
MDLVWSHSHIPYIQKSHYRMNFTVSGTICNLKILRAIFTRVSVSPNELFFYDSFFSHCRRAIPHRQVSAICRVHEIIISSYSSPAQNVHTTLQEIQEISSSLPEENIIIGADLDGHNTLWGYRSNDNRGKDILDFILANNLIIINKPDALRTFQRNNSVGWPDLTLITYRFFH